MNVGAALMLARAMGIERLDAQLLVGHVLGRDRAWLLAHDDAVVDEAALRPLLSRRASGEPLAYIVGEREFHGLVLRVTPDVLVPRPDTETLVDWALELLVGMSSPTVLDLGTGSGAIALAIKAACPHAQVHAVDRSDAALAVARDNARRLRLDVRFQAGDWWQAVPGLCVDLALSNPPYVAPSDPHLGGLKHEPIEALVPRDDPGQGLADIERLIGGAAGTLRPGGWLLVEHGATQAETVRVRMQRAGYVSVQTRRDLAGHQRASGGRLGG